MNVVCNVFLNQTTKSLIKCTTYILHLTHSDFKILFCFISKAMIVLNLVVFIENFFKIPLDKLNRKNRKQSH